MLNLLTEPLIRCRTHSGEVVGATLSQVYAALVTDQVAAFPALRPHQRHPWHAFLVQLGAMALRQERDGNLLPDSADEWAGLIRGLTADFPNDEPWQLVVQDITNPAFMQPPASSKERGADFKNVVATPDELDMLVTSKNHDLKAAVNDQPVTDDWILALVTLQTAGGFGGVGNYGISRMNGGLGNRSAFSLAPTTPSPGSPVRRDIRALLEFLPNLLDHHPGTETGHSLLWTLPWDGSASEALLLNRLHPLYIEVCRRLRLQRGATGRICSVRTSSKAARVEAKSLNGLTGDPWALIDRRDKKGDKILTLPGGGFNYKRVAGYLTSVEFGATLLQRPTVAETRSEDSMHLVARAVVRGQGKTEGYHERIIPVKHKLKTAMQQRDSQTMTDIGAISQARIADMGKVRRILSHAIQTFLGRGDAGNSSPEHRERARAWLNRLDEKVDAGFFDDLQTEFEAESAERQYIRHRWLLNDDDRSGVINHARAFLSDAIDSLPCPAIYRYRARVAADGLFEGRLRSPNGGFPDLFVDRGDE